MFYLAGKNLATKNVYVPIRIPGNVLFASQQLREIYSFKSCVHKAVNVDVNNLGRFVYFSASKAAYKTVDRNGRENVIMGSKILLMSLYIAGVGGRIVPPCRMSFCTSAQCPPGHLH